MELRMIVFLTIFSLLIVGTHLYLYRRLVHDVTERPGLRRAGKWVFFGLALVLVIGILATRVFRLEPPASVVTSYLAYGWMGFVLLLMPVLLVAEIVRLAVTLTHRLRREGPTDPERRALLARSAATLTTLGGGAAGLVALREARAEPAIVEARVPIRNLPHALHGFRIVQLSDVHVGNTIGRERVEMLVKWANAQNADLVALTGDFVDGTVSGLGPLLAPIAGLRSRHGSFFVTGNHEYYSGADAWIAWFTEQGVRVLRNERVAIEHNGGVFDLLGVDDLRAFGPGHGPDLKKAAQDRDITRPSVLLAHQPKAVYEAADQGIDLVLSGHTHGGQLWPASMIVHLVQPYVRGLYRHNDRTHIFVHAGSGHWGPPMRLGVPAEVAVIVLERDTTET